MAKIINLLKNMINRKRTKISRLSILHSVKVDSNTLIKLLQN